MAALPENDRITGPFIATAGQTDFPADFPLIKAEGLRARRERAGVSSILSGAAVSAVDLADGGFTCRLTSPALAGDRYWIYSELAPARLRQHTPNGAVRSATLEDDATELQAQLQEHRALLDRALTAPAGDAPLDLPGQAERADRFLTFDPDGRVRTVVRPADFNALGALQKDGGNLYDPAERQVFKDAIRSAGDVVRGAAAPIQGVSARVGVKWETGAAFTAESVGAYHPVGKVDYRYVFNARFDATTNPTPAPAPAFTLAAIADQGGSLCDVGALMAQTWATADNVRVVCGNLIGGSIHAQSGLKVEVLELDRQPATGSGVIDGFTLALNAFNVDMPGAHLLMGGVNGGRCADGINIIGGVKGAALVATQGAQMDSLWNSATGVYNHAAAVLSNNHRLMLAGASGVNSYIYKDPGDNLLVVPGAGAFILRNSNNTASVLAVSNSGNMAVGPNASVGSGYKLDVAADVDTEGVGIARARSLTRTSLETYVTAGAAPNPAAAAARLWANSVTNRSISAGGTVNTGGADYAEYERKSDAMLAAQRTFAKGAIVGFDADGRLTDRFDQAVSFGVKSTDPAYVGGDVLSAAVEAPAQPVFEPPVYQGEAFPGVTPPVPDHGEDWIAARAAVQALQAAARAEVEALNLTTRDEVLAALYAALATPEYAAATEAFGAAVAAHDAARAEARVEWEAARARRAADLAAHEAEVRAAQAAFDHETLPAWRAAYAAWMADMNAARAPFDRIAYCGKVPVNVTGAMPGQYLVPGAGADGGIVARLVDPADMTSFDLLARLGRVRRILPDGRAEIVVSVG